MHSPLTFLHVLPRGETISFQWLSLITPGDIYSYCFVWCENMNICLDFHSTTIKQLLGFNYIPSIGNKRRRILFLRNSGFNKWDEQAKTELALWWAPWYMQVFTRHRGSTVSMLSDEESVKCFNSFLIFFNWSIIASPCCVSFFCTKCGSAVGIHLSLPLRASLSPLPPPPPPAHFSRSSQSTVHCLER